jgi:hypothetical protein
LPSLLIAQSNPHQSRSTSFGTSGGNVNDISKAFCCEGIAKAFQSADGFKNTVAKRFDCQSEESQRWAASLSATMQGRKPFDR